MRTSSSARAKLLHRFGVAAGQPPRAGQRNLPRSDRERARGEQPGTKCQQPAARGVTCRLQTRFPAWAEVMAREPAASWHQQQPGGRWRPPGGGDPAWRPSDAPLGGGRPHHHRQDVRGTRAAARPFGDSADTQVPVWPGHAASAPTLFNRYATRCPTGTSPDPTRDKHRIDAFLPAPARKAATPAGTSGRTARRALRSTATRRFLPARQITHRPVFVDVR